MSFFSLPQLNKKSEQNTIPTKIGVSLTLPQWKVLCSATQVVDDLISRVKDRESVDWRYDLGEDSTSSSKPLNWQFTSGSTSCLMENGHCIIRREEWPWVFTNRKNWKGPYLYLKTESQNWGQWTIKWLEKIKWKKLRNRTWT
jgi:hypothetical protein